MFLLRYCPTVQHKSESRHKSYILFIVHSHFGFVLSSALQSKNTSTNLVAFSIFPENFRFSLSQTEMEVSGPDVSTYSDEEKSLRGLLDAFGLTFSLEDIASAYCRAGKNADLAGKILSDMKGRTSTSTVTESSLEARSEAYSGSLNDFYGDQSSRKHIKPLTENSKPQSVSAGTVSGIIGKDYLRSKNSMGQGRTGSKLFKPFKLNETAVAMSGFRCEEGTSKLSNDYSLHKDMEDFLFKMLGEGFQLDRDVIREVLDNCGYNMKKSMEELLDPSIRTTYKKKNLDCESNGKFSGLRKKSEAAPFKSNKNGVLKAPEEESRGLNRRVAVEQELLASLFSAPERHREPPGRMTRVANRNFPYGMVEEPLADSVPENTANESNSRKENVDATDEEDEYQALRTAVKEYRSTMKEYFTAAIDAFANGDQVRASKLMEEGQFFQKKAREADEESAEKIYGTRCEKEPEEMVLDVHNHGRKEALRLLKCHISSLAGIPSIKYLKVIIEGEEDTSKGSRRRLIVKLLEMESIEWKDGGDAGTMLIRLDNIVHRRLSFLKK